jgi:hypothetical protein
MLTSHSSLLRSAQYQLNLPTNPSGFNAHQSHVQTNLQRHQHCCGNTKEMCITFLPMYRKASSSAGA